MAHTTITCFWLRNYSCTVYHA